VGEWRAWSARLTSTEATYKPSLPAALLGPVDLELNYDEERGRRIVILASLEVPVTQGAASRLAAARVATSPATGTHRRRASQAVVSVLPNR